jgi:hypothetical protein
VRAELIKEYGLAVSGGGAGPGAGGPVNSTSPQPVSGPATSPVAPAGGTASGPNGVGTRSAGAGRLLGL